MARVSDEIDPSEADTSPRIIPPPEPVWMTYAKGKIGVHEILGAQDNAYIVQILRKVGFPTAHDETPWCSAFVNDCMDAALIAGTHKANARSWQTWGVELERPIFGCIAVLSRPPDPAHGHVGFYVGELPKTLSILGGNENNQVMIKDYDKSRLLTYRWPREQAG